jgi:hypothetical protein
VPRFAKRALAASLPRLQARCCIGLSTSAGADAGWLLDADEEASQSMSVSGNDGAACSDEDCEDHDQRSDAGDDCWDMAEGDDEALVMTVMQKVSRYAVSASSPRALHFVLCLLRIILLLCKFVSAFTKYDRDLKLGNLQKRRELVQGQGGVPAHYHTCM